MHAYFEILLNLQQDQGLITKIEAYVRLLIFRRNILSFCILANTKYSFRKRQKLGRQTYSDTRT